MCGHGIHPVAHAIEGVRRQRHALSLFTLVETVPVDRDAALPESADGFQELRQFLAISGGIAKRRHCDLFLVVCALLAGEGGCGGPRTDLQHHDVGLLPCEFHGLRETYGGTQVLAPVLGRGRFIILHPLRRHRADDRDARRVQLHAFHHLAVRLHDGFHHGTVEGMAGDEELALDLVLLQFGLQFRDRIMRTAGHAQLRPIVRGYAATFRHAAGHIFFRRADAEHASAGEFLHHAAAVGHELHGIFQREHTGQASCCEFADAVTHHRIRLDPPVHPQLREAVVHGEQRGLRVDRLFQLIGGLFLFACGREDDAFKICAQLSTEKLATLVEFGVEDGLARIQIAAHVHVLRSLSGEHEHHAGRGFVQFACADQVGVLRSDRLDHFPMRTTYDQSTVLE